MVNSVLGEPATHIATQKPVLENGVKGFDCKSSNHNKVLVVTTWKTSG